MSARRVALLAALVLGCGTGAQGTSGGGGDGGACATLQLTGACVPCMQTSCSTQSAAALGPSWASSDFTGGACSDLVACYCGCSQDRACVDRCESTNVVGACRDALQALNTCTASACTTDQCGVGTLPDAGGD